MSCWFLWLYVERERVFYIKSEGVRSGLDVLKMYFKRSVACYRLQRGRGRMSFLFIIQLPAKMQKKQSGGVYFCVYSIAY